jgi:hypothetical protein
MILVGRRDPPKNILDAIEALCENGVQIEIFKCDITNESYEIPHQNEILGIFHCAGVRNLLVFVSFFLVLRQCRRNRNI